MFLLYFSDAWNVLHWDMFAAECFKDNTCRQTTATAYCWTKLKLRWLLQYYHVLLCLLMLTWLYIKFPINLFPSFIIYQPLREKFPQGVFGYRRSTKAKFSSLATYRTSNTVEYLKVTSDMCAQETLKSVWASMQSNQSSFSAWRETLHPGRTKCAQRRFWSACANAQADLNLRWAHVWNTFSDVEAQMPGSKCTVAQNNLILCISHLFHLTRHMNGVQLMDYLFKRSHHLL